MTKKQIELIQQLASREFNKKIEASTTYVLAAMIIAMDKAHAKVSYDKWFECYADTYPKVCEDPVKYIKQAEDIAGVEIDIGVLGPYSVSRVQ